MIDEKRIFQWSQSNPKTFWALSLTCFLLLPLFVCGGLIWINPENRLTAEERKQREEIKRKHDQWETQEFLRKKALREYEDLLRERERQRFINDR